MNRLAIDARAPGAWTIVLTVGAGHSRPLIFPRRHKPHDAGRFAVLTDRGCPPRAPASFRHGDRFTGEDRQPQRCSTALQPTGRTASALHAVGQLGSRPGVAWSRLGVWLPRRGYRFHSRARVAPDESFGERMSRNYRVVRRV